jgi:hypothetical protein
MGAVGQLSCFVAAEPTLHAPLIPYLCYWTRPHLRRTVFTVATSKKLNCTCDENL